MECRYITIASSLDQWFCPIAVPIATSVFTTVLSCHIASINKQVHVPTYDKPAPVPITATRSSLERNLSAPYARTDMYKYSSFPHTVSLRNELPEIIKEA